MQKKESPSSTLEIADVSPEHQLSGIFVPYLCYAIKIRDDSFSVAAFENQIKNAFSPEYKLVQIS